MSKEIREIIPARPQANLIEGQRAPKARPGAKVKWEPGKPPGGKRVDKADGEQERG